MRCGQTATEPGRSMAAPATAPTTCGVRQAVSSCQSDGTGKHWKKAGGTMSGFYLSDGAPCWFTGGWSGFTYIPAGYISSGTLVNGYICAAGTWVAGSVYVPPNTGDGGGI